MSEAKKPGTSASVPAAGYAEALKDPEPIERMCCLLPPEYEVRLHMEQGGAWVTLWRVEDEGTRVQLELPDSADKTMKMQLEDALNAAVANETYNGA